jgi:hypothetical protein
VEKRLHHREFRMSFGGGAPTERLVLGPDAPEETRAPEASLVVPEVGGLDRVRNAVGAVLRVLGRVLYLSPALLVLKLILTGFDLRTSDYVIPVFASLLTLFFGVLCLWVAVSLPWWFFRGRKALLRFAPPPAAEENEITVRGVVAGLEPGAGQVLSCVEEESGSFVERVVKGECFAVVPEEGEPAIVTPRRTPHVLGGDVKVGDRVEVRGVRTGVFDNRERFELDGQPAGLTDDDDGHGPYRQAPGGPALRLGDDAATRLVIRKL